MDAARAFLHHFCSFLVQDAKGKGLLSVCRWFDTGYPVALRHVSFWALAVWAIYVEFAFGCPCPRNSCVCFCSYLFEGIAARLA